MQIDDPEFLEQAGELIEFYRQHPGIAAADLLGIDLNDIQKVVLRSMWFSNYVMAIMCRGAGKTFINAVFACLKCLLYPGHRVGLLAPTFRQSKMMFDECDKIWKSSPVLQAATTRRPTYGSDNCYIDFKAVGSKPGSRIQAIPLGDGTKIRGSRFYSIICDEFPHIPEDIFNMVIRPMAATVASPMENVRRLEKQQELLDAGILSEDDLEDEKVGNQIIITSSGYFTFNHMYILYCVYRDEMFDGNEKFAVFRVPYTMLPKGFLDEENVETAKKQMSSLEFRMEYEAAFIPDTDGFYKASLIEACKSKDYSTQVAGDPGKTYCLGIDPARTEDSFAICIAEMDKPAKVVHALELQKKPFPDMADLIEDLCTAFNVEHIYMDSQGGGHAIKDILAQNPRGKSSGPILDIEDEIHVTRSGRHILTLCKFGTDFISDSNFSCLRLLEHHELLFPTPPRDNQPTPAEEDAFLTITAMQQQMQTIVITETPTGKIHFDVPKGGGHGKEKKDLYTAFMLAGRCIYDVLWSEEMPESILHHGGVIKSREGPVLPAGFGGQAFEHDPGIPQVLQDKLEMAADPEAYRDKMLRQIGTKRTILTSPVAVLKPRPKKPKR